METYKKEEMELMEKFETQIKKEIEIAKLYNSLSQATFKDYYPPLEIKEDEKLIIYELVQNCLYYLDQSADEEEDYEALIAIKVFKTLFMDNNSFKIDDLDNKKYCFKLVLKLLNQDLNEDEQKDIDDSTSKYTLFEGIVKDYDLEYYFGYCLYLIFKYSKSKIFFLDAFISFMKKAYKDENDLDLEITKDESISEDELEKISEKDFLNGLSDIYYKQENYYVLYIDKELHQIKVKSNNNVIKSKNKLKENKSKREKKSQEEKKNNEENKLGHEENKFDNENSGNSNIENIYKNTDIKEEQKTEDSQKNKILKYEKFELEMQSIDNNSKVSTLQEQNNESLIDRFFLEINELKNANKKINKQINELKEEGRKTSTQINELKEEDLKKSQQINEIKIEIDKHKKEHMRYNKIIKNVKSDLMDMKKESIKLKNELRLLQLRDVLKIIIDLFCKAYQISQEEDYIGKIIQIKKINQQMIKEDEKIQLNKFFEKIYLDLQSFNKNVHSIDFSQSIIEQIFIYFDPNKELEIVRQKLLKGNINLLVIELAFNRINNFNNKNKRRLEEEKIIDSVTGIKDIYPNS